MYRPPDMPPEELMMLGRNEPCFCGSGALFGFCCYRIASKLVDALLLADRGRFTAALQLLDSAEPAPGSAEIHGLRAQIFAMKGDDETCEQELAAAFEINPDYPRGFYIRGNLLMDEGRLEEALEMYDRALELYPPQCKLQISEVFCQKGFCYFDMKDYARAKEIWREGVEKNPDEFAIPSIMKDNIYENPDVPETIAHKDDFYYKFIAPNAIDTAFDGEDDDLFDELDEEDASDGDIAEIFDTNAYNDMPEPPSPAEMKEIRNLLKTAGKAAVAGNLKKAVELIESALDISPFQPDLLLVLNSMYRELDEFENSIDCIFELQEIASDPEHISICIGSLTLYKLSTAMRTIFPFPPDSAPLLTMRIPLSDPAAASAAIEENGSFFASHGIRGNGKEYLISIDPIEELEAAMEGNAESDEEDESGLNYYFVRIYPDKKMLYVDCYPPERAGEYVAAVMEIVAASAAGEPEEHGPTVPFSPDYLEAYHFDYENDLETPEEEKPSFIYEKISIEENIAIRKRFLESFFDDIWPNTPARAFDDLSPHEAMDDEEYAPLLSGIISNMETAFDASFGIGNGKLYDFSRLREKLGIEQAPSQENP